MDDLAVPADLATALLAAGYRIGGPAGVGSGGPVWTAVRSAPDVDGPPDPADRVVVQTVTVPDGEEGEQVVVRLEALWALEHPHLARVEEVLPVDPRPPTGADRPERWAVLLREVPGATVAALLAARGRLSAGEVATLTVPIAGALDALHRAGLVHGDVSPANVVIRPDGCPVLIDLLGAVRAGGARDGDGASRRGTPGFTAPELVRGRGGGRSAGRSSREPSSGARVAAAASADPGGPAVTGAPGADVSVLPPDAPADVYSLAGVALAALDLAAADGRLGQELRAACAPQPIRRPTAAELAAACFSAATPEPIALPDAGVLARTTLAQLALQPRTISAPGGSRHRARSDRRARRRRTLLAASSAAALVVCLLTFGGVVRDGRDPARPPADQQATAALAGRDSTTHERESTAAEPDSTAGGLDSASAGRDNASPGWDSATAGQDSATAGRETASAGRDTASAGRDGTAGDQDSTAAGRDGTAGDQDSTAAVVAVADRPDPAEAAVALTHRRAEVLAAGDPTAIDDVALAGSRAHATDRALLDGLAASGVRLEGVAAVVDGAELVTATSTAPDGATPSALLQDPPVEVRVHAGLTAHRRVSPAGVTEVPAAPVRAVVLRLAWTADGWRVADVAPG